MRKSENVLDIAFYLSTLELQEPECFAEIDIETRIDIVKLIRRTSGGQKLTPEEAKDLAASTSLNINDVFDVANWANQQVKEMFF